ncbi:MAG TPA: phospholipase C, phosphocholine-specific, partial [Acinetobacter ursingii]|nr:phospholipase C, phosphocholine-specific [Acinetobacter ursingii]
PVSHDDLISPAYDEKIDSTQPLYKGIANTMPDGGFLGTFKQDLVTGKLPQVSWLVAPATYSEHPGPSSPVQGAWYIQEVLNALTENPEIWSQTVLLINFDENDGFFDHVPSPSAPSKDDTGKIYGKTTLSAESLSPEYFSHPAVATAKSQPKPDGRVYGPGIRVPMYVISPWSRGGWVNSQVFDHTSIIQFLEQRFGVKEPNISAYRRAICGDLTTAFDFKTPNSTQLPELEGKKAKTEADAIRLAQSLLPQVAVPSQQVFPQQEMGIRPSRALPYILHTSAKVNPSGQSVQLLFANTGKQAAVFHVYDRLNLDAIPRRYMVETGKQLQDEWITQQGLYDLWVLGPNGFHRAFTGNLNQSLQQQALPEIRVCVEDCEAKLFLKVRHDGQSSSKLKVKANAYLPNQQWSIETTNSEKELVWDMTEFGGWYDFTVYLEADPSYSRRFAGRIETQKDSISDPYMGYIEN